MSTTTIEDRLRGLQNQGKRQEEQLKQVVTSLEKELKVLISKYEDQQDEIKTLRKKVQELQGELDQARDRIRQLESESQERL